MSRNLASAEVPFVRYDLRHACAIRGTVVNKIPLSVMARMMGHSPQQQQYKDFWFPSKILPRWDIRFTPL